MIELGRMELYGRKWTGKKQYMSWHVWREKGLGIGQNLHLSV